MSGRKQPSPPPAGPKPPPKVRASISQAECYVYSSHEAITCPLCRREIAAGVEHACRTRRT